MSTELRSFSDCVRICEQSSVKDFQFNSVTERVLRLPNQSCSPLTPSPLLPWGGVASCQVPECVREPGWASSAVSHLCDPQYYCPVRIQITTESVFAYFMQHFLPVETMESKVHISNNPSSKKLKSGTLERKKERRPTKGKM